MKSSIVQQLSAVKVETLARVQQMSNVIALATAVISEVTFETQVIYRHWNGINHITSVFLTIGDNTSRK